MFVLLALLVGLLPAMPTQASDSCGSPGDPFRVVIADVVSIEAVDEDETRWDVVIETEVAEESIVVNGRGDLLKVGRDYEFGLYDDGAWLVFGGGEAAGIEFDNCSVISIREVLEEGETRSIAEPSTFDLPFGLPDARSVLVGFGLFAAAVALFGRYR